MAVVSMKALLEAGVHFGHQTRRWNPKMKKYIFTERNGIYIIDLQKTLKQIEEAYAAVRQTVENGDSVLFIGTKKQAKDVVTGEAGRAGLIRERESRSIALRGYESSRFWLFRFVPGFEEMHHRVPGITSTGSSVLGKVAGRLGLTLCSLMGKIAAGLSGGRVSQTHH